ncbi:MAG: PIG-L family deacetylase [Kiritimatiellae bacterium]|nr:PIG-L family deacetylase [Kiritimatiellia bacterium]
MGEKMVALAMGAHPDDIEFMMSGTLLLLKRAGAEIHICNLANGCYGSQVYSKDEAARVRALEAQAAARVAGAVWHPSLFDDTGIYYDAPSLAKATAVVRRVKPDIVLTLSRYDYMEDHEYASRLASSATFNRCLPSYVTDPPEPAYNKPVAVYHSLPHALMDMQRDPVEPEFVVDISEVMNQKREMLAQHVSQKEWLDATQGMDSYLDDMVDISRLVGTRFGGCAYAEGWRRHNHLGYCEPDFAPLQTILADVLKMVVKGK